MGKRMNNFLLTVLLGMLVILYGTDVFARADYSAANTTSLSKTQADKVTQAMLNIGNWGFWLTHNGATGHDPFTGSSGGYYPRGTAAAIYMDGMIWGGWMRGVADADIPLRVGGMGYEIGTVPGWVQSDGTPVSTTDERVRLYRIRSDWATINHAQVLSDAAELNNIGTPFVTEAMTAELIAQYKADWMNWPVDLGAPYVDVDGDGTYNPVLDDNGYADPMQGDYPGLANADQVLWIVVNDLNPGAVNSHSGAPPIGLELQITLWGYNQPAAGLGQIAFKKYRLINKSGNFIDSMFVAQYSDPDLGDYGDDLVGCDTTLSLHFVYNGNVTDGEYANFDLAPPAAGYDFFQGPIVATGNSTDIAVFDLKYVEGSINLPMTSFGYFAAGSPISDPDMGVYSFTENWYNMLNGYIPTDDLVNPTSYIAGSGPNAGNATKFPLSGDPVTDVDGLVSDIDGKGTNLPAADRRMFAASGPFVMAPGDAQELVVALVGGLGSNNLASISAMKNTDKVAQKLYDDLFATVPKPPAIPKMTATPFETSILLNWGYDSEAYEATEVENPLTGYDFEGYNVYQFPKASSTFEEAVLVKTVDLINGVTTIFGPVFNEQYGKDVDVPVIFGEDLGIKRFIAIEKDYVTGGPLYPGTTYFFAVTAYNHNPDPQLIASKALECSAVMVLVTMQGTKPGIRYDGASGDGIDVAAGASNGSDGTVIVTLVDPSSATGHDYRVSFHVDTDTNSATYDETLWNLVDVDLGTNVMENQMQLAPGTAGDDLPIVDGIQVQVFGPAPGINLTLDGPYGYYPGAMGYGVTGGTRWVSWPTDWGLETMFGALGNGSSFFGSDVVATDYVNVEVRFAAATTRPDETSEGLMAASKLEYPDRWQKAVVYRRDLGYATQSTLADIPMQVWDTENDRQLKVGIVEDDANGTGNFIWDMGWNQVDDFAVNGGREYFFILNDTYDADYTEYLNNNLDGTYNGCLYAAGWGSRGYPYLHDAFEIQIYASHVNTPADEFLFTAPAAATFSEALAKEDVKNINVFPNPYYAYNSLQLNRFDQFVTFTHLPQTATVRIFNLAGVQVRQLEKTDATQFLQWDLMNESTLPVASGLYIAHIDMPDLGKTKVLKVMIVQAKQILQYY